VIGLGHRERPGQSLTGSAQFVGIVYAPRANLKAAGGAQFYGAMTADYFTSNGNFSFHHD